MFISDPEIENCTWNVVGILYRMLNGHQYRPKYKNILNTEIKNIINGTSNLMEMNENTRKKYNELEEGLKEIKVEVSIGPINGSKNHIQVQEAVLLKCKSAHYNIVSNVLSKMANKNYFGETYKIVPKHTKSREPKLFDTVLRQHKAEVKNLCSILI